MPSRFKLVASLVVGILQCTLFGAERAGEGVRTFFVSAPSGQNANDGLSAQSPWLSLARVNAAQLRPGDKVLFRRGDSWRGQLVPQSGRAGAPITYGAYGQGDRPVLLGSISRNDPRDWQRDGDHIWATAKLARSSQELALDVGNIIFDGGRSVGVKKWRPDDLKQAGDYWYCGATWQVKLVAERNPAEIHESIELALRRHIVDQSNQSHVVYENLALRTGAAHGFGGGNTHNIVIRNCDISWIGGGHQLTGPDGKPVRFGNGIEFWENAHDNLVEGCRIWEIYDAAVTNQGSRSNSQINITYRDNVIWNSEYSFEYWNRGPESTTRNIRFEHNTCVNAGLGWGHAQRPDPNGRHLMFWSNSARTSEFSVRENIFCNATDSCLRIDNDWTDGLSLDRNCWSQTTGVLMQFLRTQFAASQFAEYQKQARLDQHSIVADPWFVNGAALDFRLTEVSPARKLGAAGGPVGAVTRLEK